MNIRVLMSIQLSFASTYNVERHAHNWSYNFVKPAVSGTLYLYLLQGMPKVYFKCYLTIAFRFVATYSTAADTIGTAVLHRFTTAQ